MNWEYFVYCRGVAQDDGYSTRISSKYIRVNDLLHFWDRSLVSEDDGIWITSAGNPYADYPTAMDGTFAFFILKEKNCCVLIHTARIRDAMGNPMMDFQSRDLWSMEGICCDYDHRYDMFAALPSILLTNKRNSGILRDLFMNGEQQFNVPDELVFNAYDDFTDFDTMESIYTTENERIGFMNLVNAIRNSAEPFSFTYGMLATGLSKLMRGVFSIDRVFDLYDCVEEEFEDEFFKDYSPVSLNECYKEPKRSLLLLECGIRNMVKGNGEFVWRIRNGDIIDTPYSLVSLPDNITASAGVLMGEIISKAESVDEFARNMLWTKVTDGAPYRYYKED